MEAFGSFRPGVAAGEAERCRIDSEAGESNIENIEVECWAKLQMT